MRVHILIDMGRITLKAYALHYPYLQNLVLPFSTSNGLHLHGLGQVINYH
jgi:hypothetical protein